jgi:anti-anti-sigma factor
MAPSGQAVPLQVAAGAVVDGTVAVAVSGDVDIVSGEAAEGLLLEVVRRESVALVTLDLAAVGFCDCAGLGALTRVRLEAQRLGRRVVITSAAADVEWLLRVTGLAALFGIRWAGPAVAPARGGPTVLSEPITPDGVATAGRADGDGSGHAGGRARSGRGGMAESSG